MEKKKLTRHLKLKETNFLILMRHGKPLKLKIQQQVTLEVHRKQRRMLKTQRRRKIRMAWPWELKLMIWTRMKTKRRW